MTKLQSDLDDTKIILVSLANFQFFTDKNYIVYYLFQSDVSIVMFIGFLKIMLKNSFFRKCSYKPYLFKSRDVQMINVYIFS